MAIHAGPSIDSIGLLAVRHRRSAKKERRNACIHSTLQYLSYEERLIRCGLTTMEKRRSRDDLIEAYKIITGKESIQWERFFELAPSKGTRGHRYKLFKK